MPTCPLRTRAPERLHPKFPPWTYFYHLFHGVGVRHRQSSIMMKNVMLNPSFRVHLHLVAGWLLALWTMQAHAQQVLTFDFAGAVGNEATWSSNFNDPGLTGSIISRGPGLQALADADRFNAKGWTTATVPNMNDYMEFTLTPQPGKQFTINKVTFKLQRNNRGPLRYVVRTSADGFTANQGGVAKITDNTTTQTRSFNFTVANRIAPLTVRLYGYKAEYSTTGHGGPGDAAGADIIVLGTTADITYYSQSNGNVGDPIWSLKPVGTPGPATFSALTHMVVQNGHTVTTTADVDVKDLGVAGGGTLVLNAGTTCTVHGDDVNIGGLVNGADNSTLALAGSAATTLVNAGGNMDLWDLTVNTPAGTAAQAAIGIRGTLQLVDGFFDASTGNVALTSNATGTGRLGPVASGASYGGNLTVQRYIPAGHTNWRMLGSPVAGQTVNEWKDDFFTAGFPGSHYPNFYDPPASGILWPSIRWYDETNTFPSADSGEVGVSSTAQALIPGQGFRAWCGDTFTGTNAFTVDLTGAPTIAQSPFTLPLSFTSSGSVPADGWNLVGNPLPSPIDFTAISRGSDVQNAYWIFDPATGTTKAWSNGVGQGGLNGILQSSQGFWMKADGTSLTTTVDESAKVAEPLGGTFGGSLQPVLPMLNLTIASNLNTYSDEAMVIFAQGSPALDGVDALKLPFKTAGAPQIGILSSTGERLALDFFGSYDTAIQVPVMVDVDITGTYTITAGMAGIRALSCLSLTDLQTGAVTPLTDGASYTFTINAGDDAGQPRFLLNGTKPVPLYVENAPCPDGEGRATVVAAQGQLGITWAGAAGIPLSSFVIGEGDVCIFPAPAGTYQVRITPGGACGELVSDFTITAPETIHIEVLQTATSCPNSTDGNLELLLHGGTAPYDVLWSTGATGHVLNGPAGSQSATITDAAGCTTTIAAEIPAGEGTFAQFALLASTTVGTPVEFNNNSVLADSYTWDFGDGTASSEHTPVHAYAQPGTYSVTLTATSADCSDSYTQQLEVDATTGVRAAEAGNTLAVWATPEQFIIEHGFGNAPVDVDVYDATGRHTLGRGAVVMPGRITMDGHALNAGIWFVRVASGDVQRTFRVPLVR